MKLKSSLSRVITLASALFCLGAPAIAQAEPPQDATPVSPFEVKSEVRSEFIKYGDDGAPLNLPIQGSSRLKAYAKNVTQYGNVGLWNASSVDSIETKNSVFSFRNPGEQFGPFQRRALNQPLSIQVLSAQDVLSVTATFYDRASDGSSELTFWGYENTYAFEAAGGWTFRVPPVSLKMSGQIGIPAGSINYAYLIKRDDNGNYDFAVNLDVRNGRIYIPVQYTNYKGQVVASVKHGGMYKQIAFALGEGADEGRVTPIRIVGTVSGAVENTFEAEIPGGVNNLFHVNVTGLVGPNMTAPVLDLRITGQSTTVKTQVQVHCALLNSDGNGGAKYPTSAWYSSAANPGVSVEVPVGVMGTVELNLLPGDWTIGFDNTELFRPQWPTPSPWDNMPTGGDCCG